ncbi:hypothetical protein D3C78_1488170 [compost metagenome]
MHTYLNRGLHSNSPVYIVYMDHGFLTVSFTFGTCHFTSMTANATLHVNKEFLVDLVIRRCFHLINSFINSIKPFTRLQMPQLLLKKVL